MKFNEIFIFSQDLRKCHHWWLVRDAISLITTFKFFHCVTHPTETKLESLTDKGLRQAMRDISIMGSGLEIAIANASQLTCEVGAGRENCDRLSMPVVLPSTTI